MSIKKLTYRVKLNNSFMPLSLFQQCRTTPMRVISVNGKELLSTTAFNNLTHFPNPAANYMVESYEEARKIMGEKLATTIVEYKDKVTGKTALTLFPCNETIPSLDSNILDRLNHDSRKDLDYQISLRAKICNKYLQSQTR